MKTRTVILCVATLLFASCKEVKKHEQRVRKVKCEEVVVAKGAHDTATFPGKVVAASDVNLSFRVAGIIDKITVKEGTLVRKGEVIAIMDKRDYELQLAATEAEYQGIKAEAERVIALYKQESVSENDYDKAVNGLKRITVKRDAHRHAVEDTELRAPFDGIVRGINFDQGEAVAAGTPIVSFISATAPEVVINIPATNYIKRNKLTAAVATIELYPETTFPLRLASTSPQGNLNQLFTTRFVVESAEGIAPTPGMTAMVTLSYQAPSTPYLAIPFGAVVEREGNTYVWLVNSQGTVNLRPVAIHQIKSNGTAIVKEGLKEGETIVAAGVNSLKEGMQVEPLAPVSKSNVGGVL